MLDVTATCNSLLTYFFFREISQPGARSQAEVIREIHDSTGISTRTIERYLCDGTVAAALGAAGELFFL